MTHDASHSDDHRLRAHLAAIVEHSNDAILSKDLTGRITSWNSSAERMYGYTAAEMLGRSLEPIVPDERRHEIREIIDRVSQGEIIRGFQTRRRHREGRLMDISINASPIRDCDGGLIGVSVISTDITEQLHRDLALRASEQRLRVAKETAQIGIYEFHVLENRIEWEPMIRAIWGLDPEEEVRLSTFFEGLHEDDREPVRLAIESALDPLHGGEYSAEYRVIHRRTGELRWVRARGLVVFEAGQARRIVGSVLDVTDRHRSEEALRRTDERKNEFLVALGHELRNPLGSLVHSIERLRRSPDPDRHSAHLESMARQTAHMTILLNDLLDVGRITNGQLELRRERCRLATIVEHAQGTLSAALQASRHRLEVSIEPPDLDLVADPIRLEQILVNLLSNAANYTPEPGLIRIGAVASPREVSIEISDTGIGLEPAQHHKIFDLFYKGRPGSAGLGVGLSLVKELVQLHGGSVTAHSGGTGQGMTVRLMLPRRLGDHSGPPEPPPGAPADLGGLRVLVVDDHLDSLHALCELLADSCEVVGAPGGAEALQRAEEFRPDAALLDLALPDFDGVELASRLRRLPDLDQLPCIAMTGFGDPETANRLDEAGFAAKLVKPVDLDRLLGLIAEVTGRRS